MSLRNLFYNGGSLHSVSIRHMKIVWYRTSKIKTDRTHLPERRTSLATLLGRQSSQEVLYTAGEIFMM